MSSVDAYSDDIFISSEHAVSPYILEYTDMMKVYKTGMLITAPSLIFLGIPMYHLVGCVSQFVGWAVDAYSTHKVCDLCEDERFSKYGLDKYFMETNPELGLHPRKDELLSKKHLTSTAKNIVKSAALPPLGLGRLIIAPMIYRHHAGVRKHIKKSFELGDAVKRMLEEGESEQGIRKWLRSVE